MKIQHEHKNQCIAGHSFSPKEWPIRIHIVRAARRVAFTVQFLKFLLYLTGMIRTGRHYRTVPHSSYCCVVENTVQNQSLILKSERDQSYDV